MVLGMHEKSRQQMLEVRLLWALLFEVSLIGDDDHQVMLGGPCWAWLYFLTAVYFWTGPKSAKLPALEMQLQICLASVARADPRQRRQHRFLKHSLSACWAFSAETESFWQVFPCF